MGLDKKQRKRIEKHFSERKTPDERREQRMASGIRKAGRGSRARRQGDDDEELDEDFEKIRRRPKGGSGGSAPAAPAQKGVLSRPDPQNPHRELVIATGIDIAVIVAALRDPPLRPGLIDRFLIAISRCSVEALICVNKMDLGDDDDRREVERTLEPYTELGIPWLGCSAADGSGVEPLRERLLGSTCVFVGHSGVGKSSLLNAIDPASERRTGAVRSADGRGRHTTTSSTTTDLGDGTTVIDTPGIRQFGLWIDRRSLGDYYPEIATVARQCKFTDCSHRHEPDCAVQHAVENGRVAPARYESYRRVFDSLPQ